jgi:5-methylcytosine-specific restriction endonuclease McrA
MESVLGGYRTIKALVFDLVHRTCGKVGFAEMTSEVRRHFPASRWQKTHWAWYRYQIAKGRFRSLFSEEERRNLSGGAVERAPIAATLPPPSRPKSETDEPIARGPSARDPAVKRIGDQVLNQVRFVISLAAAQDKYLQFKINRWVFSRLLQDEIRVKRPIKKSLWEKGMRSCQACGEEFAGLKGVEIHRKDSSRSYSVENCELMCRDCHQELG